MQQPGAFAQQFPAGLGGLGVARAAVEQQHVQRILDLAHAVGQGTWHQAQLACGGGKAAGLGNGLEHGQAVGSEHVAGAGHGALWIQKL